MVEETLTKPEMITSDVGSFRADELVGMTEAVRRSTYSAVTLRIWFDLGRLRGTRVAGRRLFLREDIERLARERKQTAPRR